MDNKGSQSNRIENKAKIRLWPLLKIHAQMDLAWLLRDTGFAVLAICSDLISNFASVASMFLLAWRFDGVGDMGRYEVLFMLGYVNLVFGLTFVFGGSNNLYISRVIGRGQLEHFFVQPQPLWVQLLTCGFFPFTCCGQFLSGLVLLGVALWNLALPITLWWVLGLLGSVLLSVCLLVSLSYLAASLTFYAPVQCEEISTHVLGSLNQVSGYPLAGMPKGLQTTFITIFPAGLLGWLPSMLLLGKSPGQGSVWIFLAVTSLSALLAGYFFKKGLQYYVKKGIHRYTSAGRN